MPDFLVAYWSQYGQAIINQLGLKKLAAGEWHGACPNCGGKDRFWINEYQSEVRVHCRQCNDFAEIQKALISAGLWPSKDNIVRLREREVTAKDFEDDAPYHIRKGVELHGAVLDGNTVVVPLFNAQREKVGHQRISPDGQKRFSTGLSKDGAFGVCGKITNGKAYICEGWATACSVYMAHQEEEQCAAIFALDAGNLPKVCEALQEAFPKLELIIGADNDEPGIKAAKATGKPYAAPGTKGADWNDIHQTLGAAAVRQGLRRPNRQESLLDELVWISDAKPMLQSNYLVKGWLGRQQMAVLYGQSNTGKSFLMLDMAYHIAAGRDWHGNKVSQGVVLYLAAEGGHGYLNRARVIADHYGDTNVPLAIRPCPVNLLDPEVDLPKLQQLIDLVKDKYGKIELIVVDTLSRALAGGNENGPEDMTAYISNADALRDHAQATVATVHHSGKADNGARGHSSLRAATDTEIELRVDEDAGIRFAKATKQRDIESGKEFAFELKSVELGCDEDGDPVTSCYITPADDERVSEATTKLSPNESLVVQCFTQLWGEQIGGPNQGGTGWPESGTRWAISEDQLRDHFFGKATTNNKRQAWQRAIAGLLGKGEMAKNDGFFWLLRQKYKL